MAKRKTCRKYRCELPPEIGGLCRTHEAERRAEVKREDDAIQALHCGTIDGSLLTPGPLLYEFHRLQGWWRQICDAVTTERQHPILKDETEYGTDWCIAIAQEIIDAEREIRAGTGGDTENRKYMRQLTWERFENLEKGLMSNGVERPANRR